MSVVQEHRSVQEDDSDDATGPLLVQKLEVRMLIVYLLLQHFCTRVMESGLQMLRNWQKLVITLLNQSRMHLRKHFFVSR